MLDGWRGGPENRANKFCSGEASHRAGIFEMDVSVYNPPGPVAAAFINDPSFVRFIMGPQGSGKTGACIFDHLTNAARMPICKDGLRRFRVVAVRNTYGDLSKTIESWLDWVPKDRGIWTGGDSRPASHKLFYEMPDCEGLEFEIRFLAVGDQRIENVFRGNEFTAGWLNEADLLAPNVYRFMLGRAGRYPPKRFFEPGVTFRRYVTGDFNAPDIDNYLYKELVEDRPDNVAFFRQPSGRSPLAENIENLPAGYYEEQVKANRNAPWWIRRMVDSEWGYSRDGEPVYPEYHDQVHCAFEPLAIDPDIPLRIGMDAGMHPAAVICQWMPNGQWRIIHEIVPGRMGPTAFAKLVRTWLRQNMPNAGLDEIYCDPSAFDGGDREGGDLAWTDTVMNILDEDLIPTDSNELHPRLDAVRQLLTYMIDGHIPALLLSPACRILRKGFAANYRYKRMRVANVVQYTDKPDKNDYSHPHDALQYAILGSVGLDAVLRDQQQQPGARNTVEVSRFETDFDVFSI